MVWLGMMGDLGYIWRWSHRTYCRMYGGGGGWRGCQGRLLVLPGAVGVMEVLSLEMRRLWGVQLQPLSFQDTIKPCRVSGGQPE